MGKAEWRRDGVVECVPVPVPVLVPVLDFDFGIGIDRNLRTAFTTASARVSRRVAGNAGAPRGWIFEDLNARSFTPVKWTIQKTFVSFVSSPCLRVRFSRSALSIPIPRVHRSGAKAGYRLPAVAEHWWDTEIEVEIDALRVLPNTFRSPHTATGLRLAACYSLDTYSDPRSNKFQISNLKSTHFSTTTLRTQLPPGVRNTT